MLRDLMVNEIVGVDATYTADVDLHTGMGVVKDLANKLAKLPEKEVGTDIVFIQKARIPTGRNAAVTNLSDYEPEFNEVKKDDKVVLYNYAYDNILGTDQFDEATLIPANVGKYVAWGTDGKATIAAGTTESCYKFLGLVKDAFKTEHTLARIYKTETVGKNA